MNQLDRMEAMLHRLLYIAGATLLTEESIMAELDDLQAAVASEAAGVDSAVALLDGLAAKLDAAIASGNPAALVALSTAIKAQTDKLAAAVTTDARPWRGMTLSEWGGKYGKIAAYTSAVIIVTGFLIRFDAKFNAGNEQLAALNVKVATLSDQVQVLSSLVQDRDKYERWRRGYNSRIKRLFDRNGWAYDDVE